MVTGELERRLRQLVDCGVRLVDPRQVYLDPSVRIDRVGTGATLHPGTRLLGARTCVGPGAEIGAEGPATLVNAVVGPRARVDGGYLEGAVLLTGARAGFGSHFRAGTVLEEEASTAHGCGLKHTILLSFVTLGSLINFCDVMMAGGTSRADHSEVGSGFIHFNFTPWGQRGDKATPSLVGDVVSGVFLRSPRIFLGGAGGLVGPGRVGYGAVTAAGQVVRKPVGDDRLVSQSHVVLDVEVPSGQATASVMTKIRRNVTYMAQLHALRRWYAEVRLARIPRTPEHEWTRITTVEAAANLDLAIAERLKRIHVFANEHGAPMPELTFANEPACPFAVDRKLPYVDHLPWVAALCEADVDRGRQWLQSIVDGVLASATVV